MNSLARREDASLAPRRNPMVPEVRVNTDVDVFTLAEHLAKSGFFDDCKQASQAVVKILRGAEMGVPPLAAMSEIHVVKGKPVLGSTLMAGVIQNSGRFSYEVLRCDADGTELEFREGSKVLGRTRFTMDDARRAGLAGKDIWKAYGEDMCFARAMSRGARRFCGALFHGGVYVPGEIPEEDGEDDSSPPRPHPRAVEALESTSAPSYAAATVKPVSAPAPESEPAILGETVPPEDDPFALYTPRGTGLQYEKFVDRARQFYAEARMLGYPFHPLPAESAKDQVDAWAADLKAHVQWAREEKKRDAVQQEADASGYEAEPPPSGTETDD